MTTSGLVFMFPLSLGTATSILVGRYLGAGDLVRAKENRQTSMLMSLCVGVTCLCGMLLFREEIARLYSNDPMVIALASSILIYTAIYQIPDNIQMSVLAALRGYNDTKAIFVLSCFCYWVLSVPIGYTLCYTDFIVKALGVYGFWAAFILALVCMSILVNIRIAHLEKLDKEQIRAKISK